MILDRRVATKKFEYEIADIRETSSRYFNDKWRIIEVKDLIIKLHFLRKNGQAVMGAIIDCSDYNYLPPSVLYTDTSFHELSYSRIPIVHHQPGNRIVIIDNHAIMRRPFLCLRGIKEYHTHPQHSDDSWDQLRKDGYNIFYAIKKASEEVNVFN